MSQQDHKQPQPAPMPFEPGHVMRREYYERLAREAEQQK